MGAQVLPQTTRKPDPKLTSLSQSPGLQLGAAQLLIGFPQGVPLRQQPLQGQVQDVSWTSGENGLSQDTQGRAWAAGLQPYLLLLCHQVALFLQVPAFKEPLLRLHSLFLPLGLQLLHLQGNSVLSWSPWNPRDGENPPPRCLLNPTCTLTHKHPNSHTKYSLRSWGLER